MPDVERALVLGGGGIAGIGWMVGLLAGLAEAGVHVDDADLVVGTSAGSVVGALLRTGQDLEKVYEAQVAPLEPSGALAAPVDLDAMLLQFAAAFENTTSPEQVRVNIGKLALGAAAVPEQSRIEVIAARLPDHEWPDRPLLITAVDVLTGEAAAFDRSCGHPLVHVVAASCAVPGVWPPVTLGDRRYMDGGVRTVVNADRAAGARRVLALAPMGSAGRGPLSAGIEEDRPLIESSGRLLVLEPDVAARVAFGPNVLDPAAGPPAARAGRAQAAHVADAVRELWR